MQRIVNPQQTRLFDAFDSVLTEKTRKRLLDGWAGVFRHVILELMPVDTISKHFDPVMGRPTKELYSMAGLLLIQEFKDWTKDETLDAYSFNMNVHYALNLEPVTHDISKRTLERYMRLCEVNDVMGVAIKRFLTQVIRHNKQEYRSLDEPLRRRYAPGVNQLFADTKKDSASRRLLRQQVAEDMYYLIRRFADMDEYSRKDTYKALERIFYEQCEVHEDKVCVKGKTGGIPCDLPEDSRLEHFAGIGLRQNARNCLETGQYGRIPA